MHKKQAALKEQLETCETQLEVFHQQSLDAEEQHEAASRITGLHDDKLREHLYDAIERVLVYDTETIEIVWKFNESKIDTDENIGFRIDSGVSFRGESVEFAPKIT